MLESLIGIALGLLLIIGIRLWDNYKCANTVYVRPPVPPKPVVYKTYLVHFPDGIVPTNTHHKNIPDFTTWSEPMVELFLLIVKDWKNWAQRPSKKWSAEYIHKSTGIRLTKDCYHGHGCDYSCSLNLNHPELREVVILANIWKDIHYGDKLDRVSNIKRIRASRVLNDKRKEEATTIRNYLEGLK